MPRRPAPPGEDRRNRILEAALKVFAAKGFKGATNKDIADAAGVTPGLIYWYFKNKEDLFFALFESRVAPGSFPLPLDHMKAFPPEQVLPMLAHFALSRLDNQDTINIFKIFAAEAVHSEQIRTIANSNINRLMETLSIYLASQMDQGRLCHEDPLLCAQMFLAALMASIMRRQFLADPKMLSYSADEIVHTTVSVFLRGMRPE